MPIQVVLAEVRTSDLGANVGQRSSWNESSTTWPWPGDGGERGVVVAAGDGVHAGSPQHGLEAGGRARSGAGDADVAAGRGGVTDCRSPRPRAP